MNGKIIIESSEKQDIIEMHLKEKKTRLFEQRAEKIVSAENIFAQAKKLGCLTDPNLDFEKLKYDQDKPEKFYILAVGPTTGNKKKVYSDYTFVVTNPKGEVVRSGNWACSGIEKKENVTQVNPNDEKKKKLEEYFNLWKKYYSGSSQYQGSEIVSELEANSVQKSTWIPVEIPNSEKETGAKKFLYISAKKKSGDTQSGEQQPQKRKDIQNATDISKDDCEKIIEQWYQNYATKPNDFDKAYFDAERPKVMYCKRRFYKKWGVDFDANRLNKIIEFMSRKRDEFEGRTSPDRVSSWQIEY